MTILSTLGPFPSGRTYGIRHITDPGNAAVHAQIRLQVKESGGQWQNTAASISPRTLFAVSSWRVDGMDGRPGIRIPQLPDPDVFSPAEAAAVIVEDFLEYIQEQEDGAVGEPSADGLAELLRLLRNLNPETWEL